MNSIAVTVKNVRKQLGLNQTDFARLVWPDKDPKITQSYISRYERGEIRIPADIYIQIVALLNKH